jgi:hypothetical protein
MNERETAAAIAALADRLRNRDPGTDDEVFAREFITGWLRGHGWRPTEARARPAWQRPHGGGSGPNDEWRQIRTETAAREHPLGWGMPDARLSCREPGGGAA